MKNSLETKLGIFVVLAAIIVLGVFQALAPQPDF